MKAEDLIMYTPVNADGEGIGVPTVVTVQTLIDLVDAEAGSVTIAQITDAGATGAAILADTTPAAVRTELELGDAYAADIVAFQPNAAGANPTKAEYDALLAALIAAGVMAAS